MKKKTVALLLALVLVFGVAVGGTIAYLTAEDVNTNTFVVGEVEAYMDETDTDDSTPGADRDKENEYLLMPSQYYVKDPTVHVDGNSQPCYVFVTVKNGLVQGDINIEAASGEYCSSEEDLYAGRFKYKTIAEQMEENGWKPLLGEGWEGQIYYNGLPVYYNDIDECDGIIFDGGDFVVFQHFAISYDVDNETLNKFMSYELDDKGTEDPADDEWVLKEDASMIQVSCYVIQAQGFDATWDAWTALEKVLDS